MQSYLDWKLTSDSSPEDILSLVEKIRQEPGNHRCFADVVQKVTPTFMITPICSTVLFSDLRHTLSCWNLST